MDGQFVDDLLLSDEIDLGENNDWNLLNATEVEEAEEVVDGVMAEEQHEPTISDTKSDEDVGCYYEPEGMQEKEPTHVEAPVQEIKYADGRLIRLVKPNSPLERVDQVIFEFTRGKFASWKFTVKSSCIYVMGFNLAKANLARFLDYGEKCNVKYQHNENRVTNITLWIGPANVEPMLPSTHPSFKLWLKRKGMSLKTFSGWIMNSIDPVPFCPWKEDIYAGNVVYMVFDDASIATGVVLKLKLLYRKVNDTPLDDFSRTSYAFLSRDDFFVWGNSVGVSDLQLLLKIGQSVLIQIFERGDESLQKCRPLLPEKPSLVVRYTAYIGWVGNVRPTPQRKFQVGSADMLAYLSKRDLTLDNFESMREGLFTHKRGPKMTQPPKKQTTKAILLMDRGSADDIHDDPHETPKGISRRSTFKDRLEDKSSSSESRLCGSCRKNYDGEASIYVGTDLIRAVSAIKSENDPNVDELLKTQEEVNLAIKLTSILSKALSKRFDMTRCQIQQIAQDIRSDNSGKISQMFGSSPLRERRSGSPQREFRSRSPKREYKLRSPKRGRGSRTSTRDCKSRSPKRDRRSRSPIQNHGNKRPIEKDNREQNRNHYSVTNVIPTQHRQAINGERFNLGYPPETFSALSNLGPTDRSAYNIIEGERNNVMKSEVHRDHKKRHRDQNSPNQDHRSLPRSTASFTSIINPFGNHHIEEIHDQLSAQSFSGHKSNRQIDEVNNDMQGWDVRRMDAEFQRLTEQFNKMKEIRERASSHLRQPYELTRARSPILEGLMESEMKGKSYPEQTFGVMSKQQPESGYTGNSARDNFHY